MLHDLAFLLAGVSQDLAAVESSGLRAEEKRKGNKTEAAEEKSPWQSLAKRPKNPRDLAGRE
jgi:hypothetical protein